MTMMKGGGEGTAEDGVASITTNQDIITIQTSCSSTGRVEAEDEEGRRVRKVARARWKIKDTKYTTGEGSG